MTTYFTKLFALVSHLFPYCPALRSEEIPEVDGMDGGAGLLVQRGFLANPVEDLPAQRSVVIQKRLRPSEQKGVLESQVRTAWWRIHGSGGRLPRYLEDDVAVGLIKLPVERFIDLHGNKILDLPHGHAWHLE